METDDRKINLVSSKTFVNVVNTSIACRDVRILNLHHDNLPRREPERCGLETQF